MPLIDYASNYTYYSEILCVNKDLPKLACKGQCVLMRKIQQQAEKENPFNNIIINAEEEIPEILPERFSFLSNEDEDIKEYVNLQESPLQRFSEIFHPPPQFLS